MKDEPVEFVLLVDFGDDGLARPRSDSASRLAQEERSNGASCFLVAHDDPILVVLRDDYSGDVPPALRRAYPRWRYLIPIRSTIHLDVVLAQSTSAAPATAFFDRVRDDSSRFHDFRGRERRIDEVIALRLRDLTPDDRRRTWGDGDRRIIEATLYGHRTLLIGRPGSGKSMYLRRLLYGLNAGEFRVHGPALRFDARRMRSSSDVWQAIAGQYPEMNRVEVATLIDSPSLRGSVWLLVDGLDELEALAREDLLEWLRSWPGPLVVTSRHLASTPSGFEVFEIEDLAAKQVETLLRQEGREDLVPPTEEQWQPEPRDEGTPKKNLQRDLCTTPLGVGLLALSATRASAPRTELLRGAILHLLEVAERTGRISAQVHRWCERKGVPLLGALAWGMIRRGHGSLTSDDLGALERAGGLRVDEADQLHQLLEAGGFVQRVGPASWEFTHKSFAEYCAAVHLAGRGPRVGLRPLLARITDPGAQEVILYFSALLADVSPVLEQLLSHPHHPLTAVSLATRILIERSPGSVDVSLALKVLRRRLRLLTWLPDHVLPGHVHVHTDVMAAIRRHAAALTREGIALTEVCHADVTEWLRGENVAEEQRSYHPRNRRLDWAEFLYRHLTPQLTPSQLLRLHDGVTILGARGRGEWASELRLLLESNGELGRRARIAWIRGAPLHHLLDRITDLDQHSDGADDILSAVMRYGSHEQRREALLRHELSRLSFTYRAPGDSPAQVSIHGRLSGLSSEHWLAQWDLAWATGMLGSVHWTSPKAQQLYASFVRDPSGPARWRALVARSALEPNSDETRWLWRQALDDPFRAVRVEAWRQLVDARVDVPPEHLLRALASLDEAERLLAWVWASDQGWCVPVDLWLWILHDPPPRPYGYGRPPAPAVPIYEAALAAHVEHARRRLLERAGEALTTVEAIRPYVDAIKRPSDEAAAREILTRVNDGVLFSIVEETLTLGDVSQRRWAAEVMTNRWWRREIIDGAIEQAARDRDPVVGQIARDYLDRRRQDELRERASHVPARVRAVAPDLEDVSMSLFAETKPDDQELVEVVTVDELKQFTRFEELWDVLGQKVLPWQCFRDMPGFATEDGPEYIPELAEQAAAENRSQKDAALAVISRLYYTPQHRGRVIDSLNDTLRGYWGMLLLAQEPRGADLLRACSRGEVACTRVARLAIDSDLSGEVAARMSDALCTGVFSPPKDPARPYLRPKQPWWPNLLFLLGGLESLLKLLHGEAPEWVVTTVLSFIEEHRAKILKSASEAERARTAAWARSVDEADTRRWTLALHLLSVVGDGDDARRWCSRLGHESLPEPVEVAALELIGRLGDVASLPTLRVIAETSESEAILVGALNATSALGGSNEANWMFALLANPPRGTLAMQARVEAWERSDARADERRRSASEAGRPYKWQDEERPDFPRPMAWDLDRWRWPCYRTIVRFGDRVQALAIARMLVDDRYALRLLQNYGRLPEHALLIFGAMRHLPADHVIPWQITGGGDEVVTDDTAQRVGGTVVDFARRVGAEDVRLAFLQAAFWDPRDEDAALDLLDQLGGPKPRDEPVLMAHLEADPAHPLALRLLATIGGREADITACWRRSAAPWWSDGDSPTVKSALRPSSQALRDELIDHFLDDPDALRRFVHDNFGDDVLARLPGMRTSLEEVCFALVQLLDRRGELGDLSDALSLRLGPDGSV